MALIKYRFLFIGILVFCVLTLSATYYIEHVLKHPPCNLCLFERVPYIISTILAFSVLVFGKYEKITSITIGLFFVLGAIISYYHFGIEQGFFNESLVCDLSGSSIGSISAEDLLNELKTKKISCKDVTFRIFELSLATFNTIISLVISVIMLWVGFNYDKN
jgi:disulfide bond formation protein DsbB